MATEIRVPTLGESVTEATIGKWFKKVGDAIAADEPLVELETDKVTVEVPAPAAGMLSEIAAKDGETVGVGALLGTIGRRRRGSRPSRRRREPRQAGGGRAGRRRGRRRRPSRRPRQRPPKSPAKRPVDEAQDAAGAGGRQAAGREAISPSIRSTVAASAARC